MTDTPSLSSEDLSPAMATSPVGIPRIGVTPAVTKPTSVATPVARSRTLIVDSAPEQLRRTTDLLALVLTLIGVLAMCILTVYARQTTTGVTQDVQNALALVLRRILVFPIQAVEVLATFALPVAVLIQSMWRGLWRQTITAALACVVGFVVGILAIQSIIAWAPASLRYGLTVMIVSSTQIGISPVFAALAGLLTGAGERRSSSVLRHSWTVVWVIVGLAVLRGVITLPGAVMSVLLGRGVGLALRYVFGVADQRVHGLGLVRALRRAGIDAVRVVRMDTAPSIQAWTVTTNAPLGYTERVREALLPPPAQVSLTEDGTAEASREQSTDPSDAGEVNTITPARDVDVPAILAEVSSKALAQGRPSVHRIYAVWDSRGVRSNVTVLDADRQFAGFLSALWDKLRIEGLSPARDRTVRAAAERSALMALEARRAGVRTPELLGIAESDESVLLVSEHIIGARSFTDLEDPDDEILADLWNQVRLGHAAGLAHRELTGSTVIVDAANHVWLLDWDSGETISSELSRRVDLAQTLALVAATAGVDRAITSARRSLTTEQLASIAPMLQRVVLPSDTREAMGRGGHLLQELRDALVALTPTAHAEPAKLTRFSTRTVIMAVIGLVALWTLLAQMNFQEISTAVRDANIWWMLAALIFSLATYLGAGLSLVAFSPVKLNLWVSTEVHLASSVVSLVAPAGVGGAAVNLRFLHRKGLPTTIGVATVTLVQVMQFLVSVALLVILTATTGQATGLTLPSGWIMVAAGILVTTVGIALAVPRVRTFAWEKLEPTYRQVWPRLVWVMSNPVRLSLGIGGTVILSLSYILAFGASLWAFGYTLPFSVLAITYLASNTVGSVVPSPGGIGPVEIALTAGLVTAGVPSGVALSTAIVYRVVTFWIPIPAGWLSLQHLQKRGDL